MKAEVLSKLEANALLESIGLRIGAWNEISAEGTLVRQIKPPAEAKSLFNFAQHLCGWLCREGSWKLIQFDNSNSFTNAEHGLVRHMLFGQGGVWDPRVERTILFKSEADRLDREADEILLAHLLALLIVYEGHAQAVSGGSDGRWLSIQDSFVYLHWRATSSPLAYNEANAMLDDSLSPWIIDLNNASEPGE